MTEQELLDRLHDAIDHAAPDDADEVLSRCGAQKGTENMTREISEKKTRRFRAAPWITAACLALVIAGGGFGMQYHQMNTVQSIVSLDVNPSVELKLNSKARVLSATALNSDGAEILEGMQLKGTDMNVAVNALVGSLLKHGYVDELANSILISVEDKDSTRGTALQQELTTEVTAILDAASVNAAILTQSVQEDDALQAKADQYGISLGKAQLIESLVANSDHLTFEALAGLTVNELNLLATNPNTPLPETVQTTGKASDNAYIGVEAAKQAAFAYAGVSASEATVLEVDFDYENGVMVYEVEFFAGVEYDCDVNAITGEVVKCKTEGKPADVKNNTSAGNGTTPRDDTTVSNETTPTKPTKPTTPTAPSASYIGADAAKAAAYQHAGVSAANVYDVSVDNELDERTPHYEVEFKCGNMEYEYKIDAVTGAVLKYESERDH